MYSKTILTLKAILLLFALIESTYQLDQVDESICKQSAQYVRDKCSQFKLQVKTLANFYEFYENFNKLNNCLRNKTVDEDSILAEEACHQRSILYASVRALGQLISRLKNGKPICTIEYAGKIYRLHNQLNSLAKPPTKTDIDDDSHNLRGILRSLGNRVATRCRKSLSQRLLSVERRAPDSVKYITVINGIMNIGGSEKVNELELEVEQFNPILQSEMLPDNMNSIGLSASGFEFKMTQQIKMALDSLKMSCQALQPYHINILGSLGLLASVGYSAPPQEVKNLNEEAKEIASVIKRWLISAILCQTMRGALKMSEFTNEGKNLGRLKIVQVQEADVDSELENDTEFETYKLPESKEPIDLNSSSSCDSFVYPNMEQINIRKLQLLEGPNYKLANAIYKYLDLTQKEKRIKIPYEILGVQVPKKQLDNQESNENDDDDDDEE